jgi:hypothetical protein
MRPRFILIWMFLTVPALAQEPQRNCASERDRNCWADLNYAARMAMEAKMAPCQGSDDYGNCIRALGWREPLYQDERFKPRWVLRK